MEESRSYLVDENTIIIAFYIIYVEGALPILLWRCPEWNAAFIFIIPLKLIKTSITLVFTAWNPGEYYSKCWNMLGQEYTTDIVLYRAYYVFLILYVASIFDIEDMMNDWICLISCK